MPQIDLVLAHAVAKNAVFSIEGLDAVLRALDMAITYHEDGEPPQDRNLAWKRTHKALLYRRELFHSTRLRSLSSQNRIQNIISLVRLFRSASACLCLTPTENPDFDHCRYADLTIVISYSKYARWQTRRT